MSGVVRGPASRLCDRSWQGSPHDERRPKLLHFDADSADACAPPPRNRLGGRAPGRPNCEAIPRGPFCELPLPSPTRWQRRASPPQCQTSPPDDDEHPDVSDPVGGDFNRNVADDSRTSHRGGIRNQYGRRNPRRESVEQATAGIVIERNLNTDPAALCGDGPRLFDQLVEILGACRSDDRRLGNATTCGSHRLSLPRPRRNTPLAMRQMEPETPAPSTAWPERPSPLSTTGAGHRLMAWPYTAIV